MGDKNKRDSEGLWELPLTAVFSLGSLFFKDSPEHYVGNQARKGSDQGDIDVDKLNRDSSTSKK